MLPKCSSKLFEFFSLQVLLVGTTIFLQTNSSTVFGISVLQGRNHRRVTFGKGIATLESKTVTNRVGDETSVESANTFFPAGLGAKYSLF